MGKHLGRNVASLPSSASPTERFFLKHTANIMRCVSTEGPVTDRTEITDRNPNSIRSRKTFYDTDMPVM